MIIGVILLRWSVYTYYFQKNIVELTQGLMHENIMLHLAVYNEAVKLAEQYNCEIKNTGVYYQLFNEYGALIKEGVLMEIYVKLFNEKDLQQI